MGISEATFYNWKKTFGGLSVTELRYLRQLGEENSQLKKLVADLSLDKQILQYAEKKVLKPAQKRELARIIAEFPEKKLSIDIFTIQCFIITIYIEGMI